MKVSIIIPSFNEGKTLLTLIKKLDSLKLPYAKELIIVDDGSTDDTKEILKEFQKGKNLKIITNKKNMGKGTSINRALKVITGEIVAIQDADMEYDPDDLNKLLKPFKDEKTSVVYGSRILGKNPLSHWTFYFGGRLVTFITNLLYGTKITDEPTGYKLFRTKVVKNLRLKSQGFEFCPEVTAKIAKAGHHIFEIPISYKPRPVSEKKIKWTDGLLAIYYLVKYRFID